MPGQLLHNLVLFGRVLRRAGVDVTPAQIRELAAALTFIDVGNKVDMQSAARAILVHRREDLATFDRAFALFWRQRDYQNGASIMNALGRPTMPEPQNKSFKRSRAGWSEPEGADGPESKQVRLELVFTYSPEERLRYKDFATFTRKELEQAKRLLQQMPWSAGERPSRRRISGGRDYIDSRAALRQLVRSGGDLFEFEWKQVKYKPRQIVALCDISGSMETYTRLLLHFLHTMETARQDVEAFVFATRLTRITRHLRLKSVDLALKSVASSVQDWSGGTRIGDAIKDFNFVWSRRVVRPGAIVIIISDGWDRGKPEMLAREMARLRRNVYRIIWLNPLAATPDYQPLTGGLRAALPFVDEFLPAHNIASLQDLMERLSRMKSNFRSARKKRA